MEEFILIIIGGGLTFLGGYVQQSIQGNKDRKKNDIDVMIQSLNVLLEIKRIDSISYGDTFTKCADNLYQLSFKIQREENIAIASEIRNFAKNRQPDVVVQYEEKRFFEGVDLLIGAIEKNIEEEKK